MNIATCFVASAALLSMAACDHTPPTPSTAPAPAPAAEERKLPANPADQVVPPLVLPGEDGDPQPPSYEVSIAAAAADHNKALERCTQQPEAVRTQCEQEANAAFSEAQQGLESLRGNPD